MAGQMKNIDEHLKQYLLEKIDGFDFERLIHKLLSARDGQQFVPLGGIHDGGADGFLRSVLTDKRKATSFIQISVQKDVKSKIRGTVKRLRDFGRDVRTLTYWTNQKLDIDVLEEELANELEIALRIRDWNSVSQLIESKVTVREEFLNYFHHDIDVLSDAKNVVEKRPFDVVSDPSIYVFLQFEKSERFGKGGLVAPIVDSLIYWSLRDSDPDKNVLVSRNEIKEAIEALLPSASNNLLPHLDERLKVLATKNGGGDQRVRYYQVSDSFCLPYQVRVELAAKSATELTLKAKVHASFVERATGHGADQPEAVADACERALYRHFNEQGLILAAFLEKRLDNITVSDQIVESELQEAAAAGVKLSRPSYVSALRVLQGALYTPNEVENEFLHRLSRTTMLLFSLKHCPQLIEYFNKMTGKFRLLIGTDILVKALSESFLPAEHRHVTNLLKVAQACGAKLLLAAPVVNELYSHLYAAHLEFRHYYAEQEPYITAQMASQSDRIMIRTYFYAKLHLRALKGWKSFIDMFVDYEELNSRTHRGEQQLAGYVCKTFGLEPIDLTEDGKKPNDKEVDDLASEFERNNAKNEILAHNDALMVLSVYAQRRAAHETAIYDGFGVRTWWLTKQTRVLASTASIVLKNDRIPYIMRPEFLLNFLTLSPAGKAVDPVVRDLLPSHVGLQIGQHLQHEHMHKLLGELENWKELPEARREIKVSEAVDQLKYDRFKRYETNFDLRGESESDVLAMALNATLEP